MKPILLTILCIHVFSFAKAQVGKVGINTLTPAAMLHVKDSSVVFTGNNFLPAIPGPPPVSGSGIRMMWYPDKAAFRAGFVNGPNWNKDSVGVYSAVFGFNNIAKGISSFASGSNNKASDNESAAFGQGNTASGNDSFAAGNSTTASGATAASFGLFTTASGSRSFATGTSTIASGFNAFAAGNESIASNFSSVAFAGGRASGTSSFAMGLLSVASADVGFSFGNKAIANSFNSTVFGSYNDTTSVSGTSWVETDPLFIIGNGDVAARSNAVTVLKNGNTGIGTISPQKLLHVSGGSSGATPMSMAVGVFEDNSSASINLITPAANESGIYFGNPTNAASGGVVYNSTPANGLSFRTNGNISRAVLDATGNFGIGDDSPNSKLHVSRGASLATYNSTAAVIIEDDAASYLQFANPSTSEAGILSGTDLISIRGGLIFRADSSVHVRSGGNSTRLTILANGNTGIGTTAPSEKLHVVGDICYTGSIGACSDIRYKKNLRPITGALASLGQIQGMYYDWNTEAFPEKEFNSDRQIGFSAQELEKIYPEVVQTDPDGFKSVDYSRLTPILVEAVKEQQTIIEEQNKKIEYQQDQINLILQELVTLKNQLDAAAIKK